jgi:uncharacterized protein YjbI with pentapeptide repeats
MAEPEPPAYVTPGYTKKADVSTEFAKKADDLGTMRDAVVDAAKDSGPLWISYLGVLSFLLVAVGGVTYKDLLLESPVKLPFLSVDLPLQGFFSLGPAIFLVIHLYVLLQFVLLADKVKKFDAALEAQIADVEARTKLRRQLPNNVFVQFLAGPRDIRNGMLGWLLTAVAWVSLIFGPVALLAFFQLQFLAYHSPSITWWQRVAVALDILMLWLLWPRVQFRDGNRPRRRTAWIGPGVSGLATLVLLVLLFGIATFPGEWLDKELKPAGEFSRRGDWIYLHLVGGAVDDTSRKPASLWSNVLVLPNFDAIDHTKFDKEEKFDAVSETISLRGRNLSGAALGGIHLRKADLTGAQLQGATLDKAQMQGADLSYADLRGAMLDKAQLQGATLDKAQLQGADLAKAQLQGAKLDGAQLQGAILQDALLQGASLAGARLQAANLHAAHLQAAYLGAARLQEAGLDNAQLQGANLDGAQLQGANLNEAQLQGASLMRVPVWHASIWKVVGFPARMSVIFPDPLHLVACPPGKDDQDGEEPCTNGSMPFGSPTPELPETLSGIDRALTMDRPNEAEEKQGWDELITQGEKNKGSLTAEWKMAGCNVNGAPYVIAALANRIATEIREDARGQKAALAKEFLKTGCAGGTGMSAATKATLTELSEAAPDLLVPGLASTQTPLSPAHPDAEPGPAQKSTIPVKGVVDSKSPLSTDGWPMVGGHILPIRLSGLVGIEPAWRPLFAKWIDAHGGFLECDLSHDGATYQCFTPQRVDVARAVLLNGGACTTARVDSTDRTDIDYLDAQKQAEKAKRGRWQDGGCP